MTLFIQNIWKLLWEMATHSRTLAWKIPWTEEPGGLQFMKSQSGTRDVEKGCDDLAFLGGEMGQLCVVSPRAGARASLL